MTTLLPESDQRAFIAALMGEDELGVVVRAHIHIEAVLLQLLDRMVVDSAKLKKLDLDYAQRVNLALALGLKLQYGAPLLALGSLRNAFAHRPDAKLSKDRVDNLYKSLAADDRQLVQRCYESTNSKMLRKAPGLRSLPPKDQFVLMATTMRAMLIAASRHVESGDAA
jgi:hypothetical protein